MYAPSFSRPQHHCLPPSSRSHCQPPARHLAPCRALARRRSTPRARPTWCWCSAARIPAIHTRFSARISAQLFGASGVFYPFSRPQWSARRQSGNHLIQVPGPVARYLACASKRGLTVTNCRNAKSFYRDIRNRSVSASWMMSGRATTPGLPTK